MHNFKVLKLSIKDEIKKLELLDKEKNSLLKRRPSNYVLRAGGSILHDFYTGIEKIFESIAKEVDRRLQTPPRNAPDPIQFGDRDRQVF